MLPPTLVYVQDSMPGYRRIQSGDRFIYHDHKGEEIRNENVLERIKNLGIPPMWQNVWICSKPRGHIQATGKDAKGRKQYIYHARWQEANSELKYDNLLNFGLCLPLMREHLDRALRRRKWDKEKVMALAVSLMDEAYLRVGNKYYEEENGTYGLTTLRRKHLRQEKEGLVLKYMAKSGKLRKVLIRDIRLRRLLRQCSELPGHELFRYHADGGFYPISSQDINEYLYEISGNHFTAKTFRTWGGTVLAVKLEPEARALCEQYPRRKMETALIRLIARELNNTVAVCRKYYIHPLVLESILEGSLDNYPPVPEESSDWYNTDEKKVLRILKEAEKQKQNAKPL